MENINIKEVQGEINYILYNKFDFDLEELKLANEITEVIGGAVNEILDIWNSY